MTDEQKKHTAKTIQELYLYPYYSKGENTLRGGAWMASWIVGIVVQQISGPQVLGGAYFIFALSLLLEFVSASRAQSVTRFVHGLFCVLLFIMLLDSLFLIFGNPPAEDAELNWFYSLLAKTPFFVGWIVVAMMFISIVLVLTEAHKFFYDEEAELKRKAEVSQEVEREHFMDNLKGGST